MSASAKPHLPRQHQTGFTIIELLIATTVFSVVLLIVTSGVLSFTRSYYKGITASKTQAVAQSVLSTIAQSIQFSSADSSYKAFTVTPGDSKGFCINNHRFSYVLGQQLVEGTPDTSISPRQTPHALVIDDVAACSMTTTPFNMAGPINMATAKEVLSPNMRLSALDVTSISASPKIKAYAITVVVAYGDNDLLDNPGTDQVRCKSSAGSQFCAVSRLSTVAQQRL